MSFGNVITAMVTPFNEKDEVDINEAIRLAHHLVDNGSDSILLVGTTGESPTLTFDEEITLFKELSQALKGRAKVMAGTGSNSTRTAVKTTEAAEQAGVDGILQVVPYYNKPSQEGIFLHFQAVAKATSLPVLLYNIPGRTGMNMEAETINRLAAIDNIFGVKEAAGSVEQVEKIKSLVPDDFQIYSGDDGLTLDFMERGAVGVVSVASHIAGRQIQTMVQAFKNGDREKARQIESELKDLFEVLFITSNPTPVKAALELCGFRVGIPRLPMVEATEDEKRQIRQVLESTGSLVQS